MLTRIKNNILNAFRYLYWKYEDDIPWVIGIIFLMFIFANAYPVDPNAPL